MVIPMSNQRTHGSSRGLRRLLSGVLCLALALSLLPASALRAQAAAATQSWAMPYMEQLVDWGVMRGDVGGNLAPSRSITRAEFVTLMNRAYGYTKLGGHPFTDVHSGDWYAQDIDIAYNMGYFQGTSVSPPMASPGDPLTREQAAVLLARNMMLQETVGETLGFSDSRTLAEWSRGLIGAAAGSGIIGGYKNADGSYDFRPKQNITRGEVAAMLVRAIGTPISEAGDYDLGAVYGNVTVNAPGVNLRNSTITGNLLLTGGVDLGDVLLENVNVLGQIVVSGAGESNSSQSSILLRNVEADEMIVDSISNQFVTIRAEGNTSIGSTKVRTNAYVDDSSLPGFGLSYIELDGDEGALLQLAGNPKEVVNKTPGSDLQFVQGVADKVTVDEKAVGSNLLVDAGTRVGELNLDVATKVTGDGDIGSLNVGAAGSDVAMLPDQIDIRPGITSNISGSNMTSTIAAESSADPRLLAGYPKVNEVAPTSATAVFSTNKAGTVYWALSAVADGSVSEDDLISPPVYGGKAVKSGNLKAAASKTEYTAKLAGLTTDGSYYLSAILVDDRGNRSPLKVTAFSTPDSTTPAFATGYPTITKNTTETAQVTAMTNKDCLLYYALLPSGSTAPKAQDFKTASISGNLGYGSREMVKNVTQPINVNSEKLDEETKYDLYLWLTDHNGAKSSSVRKITFTTPDETPPVITSLDQNLSRTSGTAVGVNYSLNEPGRLYWAIYADDMTNAFATEFGRDPDDKDSDGNSRWKGEEVRAKAFVKAGLNSIRKGTSSAGKAATEITYAISGLNSRTTGTTSYMLYVVAEDRAGNLSASVEVRNVRTLDTDPPTVTQEFTEVDDDSPTEPEADTDIRLVFNESVQGDPSKDEKFLELYTRGDTEALGKALEEHIVMHYIDATGKDQEAKIRNTANPNPGDDWVVDYRKAKVTMEDGNMVITLPYNADSAASAHNLKSGSTYYFVLRGIRDTALTPNAMNKGAPVKLPEFRVVFAHVSVDRSRSVSIQQATNLPAGHTLPLDIDFNFTVEPESVDSVENAMMWDMLIWTDTTIAYELYSRPKQPEGEADSGVGWTYIGSTEEIVSGREDGFVYSTLQYDFKGLRTFDQLNQMGDDYGDLEYAIHVTKIGEETNRAAWNKRVNMKISVVAGYHPGLTNVANGSYKSNLDSAKKDDGVATIGRPDPRELYKQFTDTEPPKFVDNYPVIRAGDITATMEVMIDRPGYVYWVAVPLTDLMNGSTPITGKVEGQEGDVTDYGCSVQPTALGIGKNWTGGTGTILTPKTGKPVLKEVPTVGPTATKNGAGIITDDQRYYLAAPGVSVITEMAQGGADGGRRGGVVSLRGEVSDTVTISNLSPNTAYLVYMVTQGTSAVYEANVECFRFTTKVAQRPTINGINLTSAVQIAITDTPTANLHYVLIRKGGEHTDFNKGFYDLIDSSLQAEAVQELYGGTTPTTAAQKAAYTVLDAMLTPSNDGSSLTDPYTGSIFDKYASTAAKRTYGDLIRSQSTPSNDIVMPVTSRQFLQADNGTDKNKIECTGMKANNNYILFVVGRSSTSSGDAFRAFYPLYTQDRNPPMITAATITVSPDDWGPNGVIKKGVVTLQFSEGLYYQTGSDSSGDSIKPICGCRASAHAGNETSICVSAAVTSTANSGITVNTDKTHNANKTPIETIELNIANSFDGAGINFSGNVCDKDGNGMDRTPLVVTIKTTKTGTGDTATWKATLEVTRSWDARTSR